MHITIPTIGSRGNVQPFITAINDQGMRQRAKYSISLIRNVFKRLEH